MNKELDYINHDLEKAGLSSRDIIPNPSLKANSLNVPIAHSSASSIAQVPVVVETNPAPNSRKRIHLDASGDSMILKQIQTPLLPKDTNLEKQLERLSVHMTDIVNNYFRSRSNPKDSQHSEHDELFSKTLMESSRYHRLKTLASIHFADHFLNQSSSIVSSIEFDKDDEFFVTAGVTKKIKLFQFDSVISTSSNSTQQSSFITKNSSVEEKRTQYSDEDDENDEEQPISLTPKYPMKEMMSASKIRYGS